MLVYDFYGLLQHRIVHYRPGNADYTIKIEEIRTGKNRNPSLGDVLSSIMVWVLLTPEILQDHTLLYFRAPAKLRNFLINDEYLAIIFVFLMDLL